MQTEVQRPVRSLLVIIQVRDDGDLDLSHGRENEKTQDRFERSERGNRIDNC